MSKSNRKRSRKPSLVSRDCGDEYEERNTVMQTNPSTKYAKYIVEHDEPKNIQHNDTPVSKENSTKPSSLQISVNVEVETFDETDIEPNIEQNIGKTAEDKPIVNSDHTSELSDDSGDNDRLVINEDDSFEKHTNMFDITEESLRNEISIINEGKNDVDRILGLEAWNYYGHNLYKSVQNDKLQVSLNHALLHWKNWALSSAETEDNIPLVYKCYICLLGWWYLEEFDQHMRNEHFLSTPMHIQIETKGSECNIVAFSTNMAENKDVQMKTPCYRCDLEYSSHLIAVNQQSLKYSCRYCLVMLTSCYQKKLHEISCLSKKLTSGNLVECKYCFYDMPVEDMSKHLDKLHRVRSDLPIVTGVKLCIYCRDFYISRQTHNCQTDSKYDHIKCKHCNKIFWKKSLEQLHLKLNPGGGKCRFCVWKMPNKCMEVEHLLNHTDNYMFVSCCVGCEGLKVCADYRAMIKHVDKYHASNKKLAALSLKTKYLVPKSCVTPKKSLCGPEVSLNNNKEVELTKNNMHHQVAEENLKTSQKINLIKLQPTKRIRKVSKYKSKVGDSCNSEPSVTVNEMPSISIERELSNANQFIIKILPPTLDSKKKSLLRRSQNETCDNDSNISNYYNTLFKRKPMPKLANDSVDNATILSELKNNRSELNVNTKEHSKNTRKKYVGESSTTNPKFEAVATKPDNGKEKVAVSEDLINKVSDSSLLLNMQENINKTDVNIVISSIKSERVDSENDENLNLQPPITIKQEVPDSPEDYEDALREEMKKIQNQFKDLVNSHNIKEEKVDYEDVLSNIFQVSSQIETRILSSGDIKSEIEEYEDDIIVFNDNFSGSSELLRSFQSKDESSQDFSDADNNSTETEENKESLSAADNMSIDSQQDSQTKDGMKENEDFKLSDLESELKDTGRKKNKKKKLYRCVKKCGFRGLHMEFKNHLKECNNVKRRCPGYEPVKQIQEIVNVKCSSCAQTFETWRKYYSHFVSHGYEKHTCPECLMPCWTTYGLLTHMKMHIRQMFLRVQSIDLDDVCTSSRKTQIYQCRDCKAKVHIDDFFVHYESHLQLNIKIKQESLAEDPPDEAANEDVMNLELKKKLIDYITDTNPTKRGGYFICLVCNRRFNRRTDVKRHTIEHLLEDAYASHDKYLNLRCQICHHDFTKPEDYKMHMREHASLPVYKCELCDKTFSDSSNFTKHKKIHNLQFSTCDVCQKKFQAKSSLEKHLELHATTPEMKCDICGKILYSQSSLKKHMFSHNKTAVRYTCRYCNQKFTRLKFKWEHLWEAHQIRSQKADCPLCDRSFRRIRDVQIHLRDNHKINTAFQGRKAIKHINSQKSYVAQFLKSGRKLKLGKKETVVIIDGD